MADRIKLRRGPKNNIDLNVYELGYVTDSNEERLYFNNGSMVPIPNNKDITDIKTELTETTNISNKNKQDVSELKESVAGIIKTGVAKLVQYSYDIELSENTKKVNIPYERYSSVTDTLKVYVNGLAIQNDQYTITDPVENEGIVTNGYIVLKVERPAGTIVRIEVWKNVPSGEEGEVSGNIITKNSLPLDRIIGINDITSNISQLSNPNLLINGDFQVWQRGENFNYNGTNNSNIYTADRWRLIQSNEGATARVYKSSEIEENTLTISEFNKPSGIEIALSQKLDYSLQKEDGKRYTLSLLYSSTLNAELRIREYDTNNILGRISMPSSAGISRVSFTFDSSNLSKKNNRVEIYISFGSEETYNNNKINLSNVKLEVGSIATSFSPRPYAEELALCQRYFIHMSWDNTSWIHGFGQNGMLFVPIPNTMRVSPTLFGGASEVVNWLLYSNGSRITATDLSVRAIGENGILLQFTGNFENNHTITGHYNSGTPGGFDAEIY